MREGRTVLRNKQVYVEKKRALKIFTFSVLRLTSVGEERSGLRCGVMTVMADRDVTEILSRVPASYLAITDIRNEADRLYVGPKQTRNGPFSSWFLLIQCLVHFSFPGGS